MRNIKPIAPPPAPDQVPSPAVTPLTYSRHELTLALGISLASLDRLDAAGQLPAAKRIGGRKLWVREEIAEWLRADCPGRREWEAIKAAGRNGKKLV
jgi:predicted DNA-binding transcriptional regulator AlpA